jgi:CelD/BcsL family acetyltransferase involved in cellulose biosynthesis
VDVIARVVESLDCLDPIRGRWDELAVAASRPFAAPSWALAWWRHLAPAGAELRVVVVEEEGGRLAGVLPFYSMGRVYRTIGAALAPVEPVARPGLEAPVASAAAELLAAARPRVGTIELKLHGSAPDWARMLGSGWPGRGGASIWTEAETPAPLVELGEGLEAFLSAKSKSFRRDIRRSGRRLEEAGTVFRLSTAETLERDIGEFLRLHRERLADRGGSNLPAEGVEQTLAAVGAELLPSGRFRLLCLDFGDRIVAADLLLAAGSEVSAWNSGFDAEFGEISPVMQCLVHALAEADERGEKTMSLGPGEQPYKYRLANAEDSLRICVVIPRRRTYPLAEARLLPRRLRRALSRRLTAEGKRRLRRLAGQLAHDSR